LHQWLQRGPAQARVDSVLATDAADDNLTIPAGFDVF